MTVARVFKVGALALAVVALNGCSVGWAFTAPLEVDVSEIAVVGHDRMVVEGALNLDKAGVMTKERGLTRVCYEFTDGLPLWSNILRGVAWLAADVATLCLTELLTWPIELGIAAAVEDNRMASIYYDDDGLLVFAQVFAGDEVLFTAGDYPALRPKRTEPRREAGGPVSALEVEAGFRVEDGTPERPRRR